MPSIVNIHGIQVDPIRPIELDDEKIERARIAIMVKLHAKRVSTRAIGKILGCSHMMVVRRLREMPRSAYDYFRKLPL